MMAIHPNIYIYIHILYWLVVYLPLRKMMEFVSWDDDIPNWMEKTCSKPPTSFTSSVVQKQILWIDTSVVHTSLIYVHVRFFYHFPPFFMVFSGFPWFLHLFFHKKRAKSLPADAPEPWWRSSQYCCDPPDACGARIGSPCLRWNFCLPSSGWIKDTISEAPKIAFSWFITPISLGFMVITYNYSYWGESKPTNITGGPHIVVEKR